MPATTSGAIRPTSPTIARPAVEAMLEPPPHPGDVLLEEFLRPLGVPQTAFAARLRVPLQRLNDLVRGRRGVTPDTALRLARALGTSPRLWMALQESWDLWQAAHGPRPPRSPKSSPCRTTEADSFSRECSGFSRPNRSDVTGQEEHRSCMPQTRITERTHRTLKQLAADTGHTFEQLIEQALAVYQREQLLHAITAGYAGLRSDPDAWAAELWERAQWDMRLTDGLDGAQASDK